MSFPFLVAKRYLWINNISYKIKSSCIQFTFFSITCNGTCFLIMHVLFNVDGSRIFLQGLGRRINPPIWYCSDLLSWNTTWKLLPYKQKRKKKWAAFQSSICYDQGRGEGLFCVYCRTQSWLVQKCASASLLSYWHIIYPKSSICVHQQGLDFTGAAENKNREFLSFYSVSKWSGPLTNLNPTLSHLCHYLCCILL